MSHMDMSISHQFEIVYTFLPNEPFGCEPKIVPLKDSIELDRALEIIKNEPNKYELIEVRDLKG